MVKVITNPIYTQISKQAQYSVDNYPSVACCLLWVSDLLLSCSIPPGYQSDPRPFSLPVRLLRLLSSSSVAGCHTRLSSPRLRFNEFECPVCCLSETYFGKLIFNTLVSFLGRCTPRRHATAGISRNAGIKATIKKYRPCIIRESMCISGNLHIEAERRLPSLKRTERSARLFRSFLVVPASNANFCVRLAVFSKTSSFFKPPICFNRSLRYAKDKQQREVYAPHDMRTVHKLTAVQITPIGTQ